MVVWKSMLAVGFGGFAGACMRYGLSLIPVEGSFPAMTFITNILGAILIGIIAETASQLNLNSGAGVLFFKTGVCGGFTTFSTFSLETITLLEKNRYVMAGSYAVSSVICCLLGVIAGKLLVRAILSVAGLKLA